MKLFRYWMNVPLKSRFGFNISHPVVPVTEINERTLHFEEIVEAVKKSGCDWSMHELTDVILAQSPNAETTHPHGTP